MQVTPNYRFVCPQLASTAKIAEVHQKHNGNYKALRSADKNPEPQKFPKGDEVSEGALERSSPDEAGKEAIWHITDSVCVCLEW